MMRELTMNEVTIVAGGDPESIGRDVAVGFGAIAGAIAGGGFTFGLGAEFGALAGGVLAGTGYDNVLSMIRNNFGGTGTGSGAGGGSFSDILAEYCKNNACNAVST